MRTTLCSLLALMLLAVPVTLAQPGDGPGMMKGPGGPDRAFMERLNLTDQQKTDLHALRSDLERTMVKNQADIRLARIDLKQLLAADKLDRTAIEKKLKEVSNLQHETKLAVVGHLFSVNAKLTPEQQKMFKNHMAQRVMEERGPMNGRRPGGRGRMMHEGSGPR